MNNGFAINPPLPQPFSSPILVLYDCVVQTLVQDNGPLSALPASVHWPLHYFLINADTKSSLIKVVLVALVCCEATQSNPASLLGIITLLASFESGCTLTSFRDANTV